MRAEFLYHILIQSANGSRRENFNNLQLVVVREESRVSASSSSVARPLTLVLQNAFLFVNQNEIVH